MFKHPIERRIALENNIQIKIDEHSVTDLYCNSGTNLPCKEFIWRNEIIDGIYVFYADSLHYEWLRDGYNSPLCWTTIFVASLDEATRQSLITVSA